MRFTNLHNVLSTATATPWAILPEKLEAIRDVLSLHAEGGSFTSEEIAARVGDKRTAAPSDRMAGSVAVIPLYGSIFPRANMMTEMSGATSLASWVQRFQAAANNPDVSAIVIDTDSPGGVTSGVTEAADAIFAARQQKPVIAVANTLMASAAYWLGSQADLVVASPSADVGSVGVYAMHVDASRQLANDGLEATIIKAGRFKAEGNPYEPLSPEARAEMQARVDETYGQFVKALARGRGVSEAAVKTQFGEGRVLSAPRALAAGMVDRVATLDQIVAELNAPRDERKRRTRAELFAGASFAGETVDLPALPMTTAALVAADVADILLASDPSAGSADAVVPSSTEPAPQAEETTVSQNLTPAPSGATTQDDRAARLAELVELRPEAASKLATWITNGTTYEQAKAEIAAGIPAPAPHITVGAQRETQKPWESFGHFAKAVYDADRPGARDTDPRLFAAATGINQASPSEGGFAVPGQYSNQMWDSVFADSSSVLSMTDNYDVEGAFIEFPRIEETTRASGTVYGGVQAYWRNEADQITSSRPKFGSLRLEPQELDALVYITEKHLNNSPVAMGQYIDRMGRAAIALKANAAIINGDGAGKPKGLTVSGSKITVTKESSQASATLLAKNVGKMKARRIASVASQYVWLANTDIQPELDVLSTTVMNVAGTENVGGFSSPLWNNDTQRLGGLPLYWNDQCAALGTEGDLILVHLPSYAVGMRRGGLQTASSMHLRFDYKEVAFRFSFELDGQSWLPSALTPEKGSTKSNVITLQAR